MKKKGDGRGGWEVKEKEGGSLVFVFFWQKEEREEKKKGKKKREKGNKFTHVAWSSKKSLLSPSKKKQKILNGCLLSTSCLSLLLSLSLSTSPFVLLLFGFSRRKREENPHLKVRKPCPNLFARWFFLGGSWVEKSSERDLVRKKKKKIWRNFMTQREHLPFPSFLSSLFFSLSWPLRCHCLKSLLLSFVF